MIRKLSPAKVNLHLTVIGKREDGYHNIATLMQPISLYDEMTFDRRADGVALRCPDSPLPEDEGNIVYRAARMFFSLTSAPGGIAITLRKRIPLAAGLGGGSSNAATTLLALNEMTGGRSTKDELMNIGKDLGADVPFFIFGKPAWAMGIGDRLHPAEQLPPFWFVLINPGFPVSTKMVYDSLNLRLTKEPINYSIPCFHIGSEKSLTEGLKNDLEEVTVTRYPLLDQLKKRLLHCGAWGALMSGSGPTVFGIFGSEELARAAQGMLSQEGLGKWAVFLAHSL